MADKKSNSSGGNGRERNVNSYRGQRGRSGSPRYSDRYGSNRPNPYTGFLPPGAEPGQMFHPESIDYEKRGMLHIESDQEVAEPSAISATQPPVEPAAEVQTEAAHGEAEGQHQPQPSSAQKPKKKEKTPEQLEKERLEKEKEQRRLDAIRRETAATTAAEVLSETISAAAVSRTEEQREPRHSAQTAENAGESSVQLRLSVDGRPMVSVPVTNSDGTTKMVWMPVELPENMRVDGVKDKSKPVQDVTAPEVFEAAQAEENPFDAHYDSAVDVVRTTPTIGATPSTPDEVSEPEQTAEPEKAAEPEPIAEPIAEPVQSVEPESTAEPEPPTEPKPERESKTEDILEFQPDAAEELMEFEQTAAAAAEPEQAEETAPEEAEQPESIEAEEMDEPDSVEAQPEEAQPEEEEPRPVRELLFTEGDAADLKRYISDDEDDGEVEDEAGDGKFLKRERPASSTTVFDLPEGIKLPAYIDDDEFLERWLDEEGEDMAVTEKRTKRRISAIIGSVTMIFALIGFVWVMKYVLGAISGLGNTDAAKLEYENFISPVVMSELAPFEAWDAIPQEKLSQCAIFQVLTNMEENTYKIDDTNKMIIPSNDILLAAKELFGPEVALDVNAYNELNSDDLYYSDTDDCFHVAATGISGPQPDVTAIAKKNNTITLTVGYIEETGSAARADYFQMREFVLTNTDDGYYISAIRSVEEK